MGHFLFFIYVNDLTLRSDSNFTLFGDDTTIIEKSPSFDFTILNGSIKKVDRWIEEKKPKSNVDKSKVVFGKSVFFELSFRIHDILINLQLKYLSVVIDEKLTISDHCAIVKNNMLYCNYHVPRARYFVTRSHLLSYYKTHIKTIVQYGIPIFGCTSYSSFDPVLKIQKVIVRSTCFFPKDANVPQFIVDSDLSTVCNFRVYELLKNY